MKKNILVIDACVRREESRTKKLLDAALDTVRKEHPDWNLEILNLMDMDLMYWKTETLRERDELLAKKEYDAPVFKYGNQFREADGMIVAAPFWDLSVPAVLKVYIENVSAEGITFGCNEEGLYGLCRAKWMLFLTTRGGIWADSNMEQGSTYMEALCKFFGIDEYACVYADGIDIRELDGEEILHKAVNKTKMECSRLCSE